MTEYHMKMTRSGRKVFYMSDSLITQRETFQGNRYHGYQCQEKIREYDFPSIISWSRTTQLGHHIGTYPLQSTLLCSFYSNLRTRSCRIETKIIKENKRKAKLQNKTKRVTPNSAILYNLKLMIELFPGWIYISVFRLSLST